jgi:uncharacterized cupredoxin-like copper-binding protein
MRRVLVTATTLSILTGFTPAWAGPGHGTQLGRPGDLRQATRTIEVVMDDEMRFTPAKIEVKRGETVRFVVRNVGEMKHEMMLGTREELRKHAAVMQKFPDMEHDDDNAVSVDPGKAKDLVWYFSRTGNFMFGCLMPGHYEAGMVGTLVVQRSVAGVPQPVRSVKADGKEWSE